MLKSFFNSMTRIIAATFLTVSIANAQVMTDGDIIHMRDANGTLTADNLVEIGNTSSSTTLDLFFRVTISDTVATGTLINLVTLVPTNQTAPTPTFHYKDGNQWSALQTSTSNGIVSIAYSVLEGIATAQSATTVEVRVRYTTVPAYRFQLQLGHGTVATTSLDRVYFDCQTGTISRAIYDVTNDGQIDNADITAVSQAITNKSLTGDVSEDGKINYVDFDLVTFAVAQNASIATGNQPSNRAPIMKKTIPDEQIWNSFVGEVYAHDHFSDPDGDTLTYAASTTDSTIASVSVGGVGDSTVYIYANALGTVTITVTVTDPGGETASQAFSVTVVEQPNRAPETYGSIPSQKVTVGGAAATVDVSSYFNDPDTDPLTYTASSSDTGKATVSVSSATVSITPVAVGTATMTVTASDPDGLTATQSFVTSIDQSSERADPLPAISSEERERIANSLAMNRVIFNELRNASTDTHDWVELRNVSNADVNLSDWQVLLVTGEATLGVSFSTGTVLPAGGLVLLTNTDPNATDMPLSSPEAAAYHYTVDEGLILPQENFTLLLRSSTGWEDSVGNYFFGYGIPSTAPPLTADSAWYRARPDALGYQAEAWAESGYQGGIGYDAGVPEAIALGTPGYSHSLLTGDVNRDGVVNILDLLLVALHLGRSGKTGFDLNSDGIVNIYDLLLVANAFGSVLAAPTADGQVAVAQLRHWLNLADEELSRPIHTSTSPHELSYERGIEVLEQMVRELIPQTTALLPNYPNPFNPETWIPYHLAKASHVQIIIYDARGHGVRSLDIGYQPEGYYATQRRAAYWDGTNERGETVASGTYFYSLTAGDFSATRKMLILK